MKTYSLIIILFQFFLSNAQAPKQYDLLHLDAQIVINPYQQKVSGNLIYHLRLLKNTDSIVFDAPGINIEKIKTGCFNTDYTTTDKLLIINKKFIKNKTYKIHIEYQAYPKQAMYFTGWRSGGRKQVWTQGQGKDNSHWLPTNSDQNDKFTWVLSIDFPKNYRVISNGLFVSGHLKNNKIATSVYQQLQPAPAYLIFIGAGKYLENKILTSNGIPVYNYQYTDHQQNDKTYYKSKEIFDALEQEIGFAYPWPNYKQIPCRDFLYGGMENVSATSFNGDRYVVDSIDFNDVNFVNVSAHELTHQWFGDLVTGKSSADHWLHEAFATYYARLIDRKFFGKNYADYQIYQYDRQIIARQYTDTIPLHRPKAGSLTYYQKGAKIIAMLRQKIGDENYRKLIQTYFARFAFNNADTQDFKRLLFDVTGDSIPSFFKIWFEDYRIPEFDLVQRNDSIIFNTNSHNLSLDFLIITNDNKTYQIQASKGFKLPEYQSIKTVIANPDNQKLYHIKFAKPDTWLYNQILFAPAFIDRYKALIQIRDWKYKQKDVVFQQLINRNEYYPVYKEIINQIKDDLNNKHLQMLARLFQKDLKTRQQLAIELHNIPLQLKTDYKSLLNDASYVTKQTALWHYWVQFSDERKAILNKTQEITGGNNKTFRMIWLSLAIITKDYKNVEKQSFIKELVEYGSPDYNMLVRLNAFEMLIQMQIINADVIENLFDAALHFNWRLHQPARRYLKSIYQNKMFRPMIEEKLKNLSTKQQVLLLKYLNK